MCDIGHWIVIILIYKLLQYNVNFNNKRYDPIIKRVVKQVNFKKARIIFIISGKGALRFNKW